MEIPVQNAVKAAFHSLGDAGQPVRNALHGTWLHQPLHAVITDVPVGAWTATVVFDAIAALGGGDALNTAADATNVLGLVGALAAAATGLNDWADVREQDARRIGAIHGMLNVVALGLFGASWLDRRGNKARTRARLLAGAGFLVIAASSHLGGNLVYEHGIGVQDTQPLE